MIAFPTEEEKKINLKGLAPNLLVRLESEHLSCVSARHWIGLRSENQPRRIIR